MPQAWNLRNRRVWGADFQKTKFGRVWYGTLDDWDKNLNINFIYFREILYNNDL